MGIIMKIGSSGKESFDNFDIGQMKVGSKTTIIEDGKIVQETEEVKEVINEETKDVGEVLVPEETTVLEGEGEIKEDGTVEIKTTKVKTTKNK